MLKYLLSGGHIGTLEVFCQVGGERIVELLLEVGLSVGVPLIEHLCELLQAIII